MHRLPSLAGRALAASALAFALCACASGGGRAMTPGHAFMLAPGEAVELPDAATLRYVRVAQDSRCPPDVQCIRAGDADVVFEYIPAGGAPVQVDVNLPESPQAPMGAWRLQLLALEFSQPARATVRVDATP